MSLTSHILGPPLCTVIIHNDFRRDHEYANWQPLYLIADLSILLNLVGAFHFGGGIPDLPFCYFILPFWKTSWPKKVVKPEELHGHPRTEVASLPADGWWELPFQDHLDNFWGAISQLKLAEGSHRFPTVSKLMKPLMCIPHSNMPVVRGHSACWKEWPCSFALSWAMTPSALSWHWTSMRTRAATPTWWWMPCYSVWISAATPTWWWMPCYSRRPREPPVSTIGHTAPPKVTDNGQ